MIVDSTYCLDAQGAKWVSSINFNLYSVGKTTKYHGGGVGGVGGHVMMVSTYVPTTFEVAISIRVDF